MLDVHDIVYFVMSRGIYTAAMHGGSLAHNIMRFVKRKDVDF